MTKKDCLGKKWRRFMPGKFPEANQSAHELDEGARLYNGRKGRPPPLAPPVAAIGRYLCQIHF